MIIFIKNLNMKLKNFFMNCKINNVVGIGNKKIKKVSAKYSIKLLSLKFTKNNKKSINSLKYE